jgi:hypothetical protein
LVERSALDPVLVDEQAIVLPDKLIDRERQPHAERWLAQLPLVAISGLKWERLVAADRLRVYRVAVDERGGRTTIGIEARGGGRARIAFEADLAKLKRAIGEQDGERQRRLHPEASLVDRLLRRLSGEVLCEDAVVLAWQAAQLLEPGYGYRGAPDGTPVSIEGVELGVRGLEAVRAQIDRRAAQQREQADAIVAALAQAEGTSGAEVAVPQFHLATRVVEEELTIDLARASAEYSVDGEPHAELRLPSYDRFFVAEIEPWQPELPAALRSELADKSSARKPPPEWLVLVVVAVLLAIALTAYALK